MVSYHTASALLWALYQANPSSAASLRSLQGKNVTVAASPSNTYVNITARCNTKLDSIVNLYFEGSNSSVKEGLKRKERVSVDTRDSISAASKSIFTRHLQNTEVTTNTSLGEGTPIYPNSTAFMMQQVNLPDSQALQSANIASTWINKGGEIISNTGFITLIRTTDEVGNEVSTRLFTGHVDLSVLRFTRYALRINTFRGCTVFHGKPNICSLCHLCAFSPFVVQ